MAADFKLKRVPFKGSAHQRFDFITMKTCDCMVAAVKMENELSSLNMGFKYPLLYSHFLENPKEVWFLTARDFFFSFAAPL